MTSSLAFLNALCPANRQSPPSLFVEDVEIECTDAAIERHLGQSYTSALTADGVSFVFGLQEGVARDAWQECRVPVTAALYKGSDMIVCWALDRFASEADVVPLAVALGMTGLDEQIPTPGTDGWELVHADGDTFSTLAAMNAAYVTGDDPKGGKPVKENAADESQDEDEPELFEETVQVGDILGNPVDIIVETYGDAKVLTPYNENDYLQPIIITVANRTDSKNWKPEPMPVGKFIATLCVHKEGQKDGNAFVLGDLVPGQRLKNSVKALYGIGLDIDTGTPSRVIDAALTKLGLLAVRYTTHSHGKTTTEFKKDKVIKFAGDEDIDDEMIKSFLLKNQEWDSKIVESATYGGTDHTDKGIIVTVHHNAMPKHRIVIPLAVPFEIGKEGKTQKEAQDKWAKVPAALAALLGVPFDKSCVDPCRLFYFPRHQKDRKFEISLFGGPLFDWNTLELDNALEKFAETLNKGKSKSVTAEGKALGRWSITHASGFQIADLLEDHAQDKLRGAAGGGFELECPFDEDHSNAGESSDRACYAVNAGYNESAVFTISCRHESCRNKTNLDMLSKMIKDEWFDRAIIDEEHYHSEVDGVSACPNTPGPFDSEGVTGALSKASLSFEIENALTALAISSASKIEIEVALNAIKNKTGIGIKPLRKTLVDNTPKNSKETDHKISNDIAKMLGKPDGKPFQFPPEHFGEFQLEIVGSRAWMSQLDSEENTSTRLCSPFQLIGGIIYEDRGQKRAFRIDVFDADDNWRPVDLEAGDLANIHGVEPLKQLLGAGLCLTNEGRKFVLDYLQQSQPRGMRVYHRPGVRGNAFVCPTGEILLTNEAVELAAEVRLNCPAKAGTLEAWREGAYGLFNVASAIPHQASVLMGLAGVLTAFAGDDSLAYSLEGVTSTGKSTMQMLAVAHWASPELGDGLFISGKGTENSQEVPLERGSGTITALDEVSSMAAKSIQEFLFLVQGGIAKRRLNAKGQGQKARQWNGGTVVISAETGFAQRLAAEGVRQAGGLSVRVLPIITSEETRVSAPDWVFVTQMLENFGLSGPAFVLALADQGYVADKSLIKEQVATLIALLPGTSGTDNIQRYRAARLVAYLWATALIAIEAGLLPDTFDAETFAKTLWAQAMASDLAPENPAKRALRVLCDKLVSSKGAEIRDYNYNEAFKEAFGYFGAKVGEDKVYVVRVDKLSELSGGFIDKTPLLKELDLQGYIIHCPSKKGRTWSGFPRLGKNSMYVIIRAAMIDAEDPDKEGLG